jgi:DUF1707 SHOCT-like domain
MTESVSAPLATGIRCSDADRERITERLRAAAGEGRLTMDELDDRLAGVYATKYCHELDAFVADLPRAEEPPSTGWHEVFGTVWAQLSADLALLFGRRGAGWSRRRIVVAIVTLMVVGLLVAAAFHGFGSDGPGARGGGFEPRGFDGPPFGGRGHH